MYYTSIPLSVIELIVLLLVMTITIIVIRFFIISQRNLRQAMHKTNQTYFQRAAPETPTPGFIDALKAQLKERRKKTVVAAVAEDVPLRKKTVAKEESVHQLKDTIQQQQRLLTGFLKQIEEVKTEGNEELAMENKLLQKEVNALEKELEEKSFELEALQQQVGMTNRMNHKIEEAYQELEELQHKMLLLEKQAGRANNLAIELEDTRQSYEQIHKDLQRKTEKLNEAFEENEKLKQDLRLTEDKLAEANLQRQQLQRKIQFLQELNIDLQSVSDTNKKLNTELRRISELESMLNMIAEERDYLLQKQSGK